MKCTSRISTFLIVISLASVAFGQAKQVQPSVAQFRALITEQERQINAQLQTAAAMSHLKLEAGTITLFNVNGAKMFIGAMGGDSSPITNLPKGIDVAFGFFDLGQDLHGANQPLPAGVYTIRMMASRQDVDAFLKEQARTPPVPQNRGNLPSITNSQAEFVDLSGKVIAKMDSVITVRSLDKQSINNRSHAVLVVPGSGRYVSFCIPLPYGHSLCYGLVGWHIEFSPF